MPIPKPTGDESQSEFMARCMGDSVMNDDYPDNPQRAAVCHSQWRRAHGGKQMRHVILKSEDGKLKEQDMTGEELSAWFHENTKDGTVLQDITLFTDVALKAVDGETADWVLSDMSLDRDMERVDPNGGDFKNYKQNPVVLWSHDYTRPAIGKMENCKVKDGQVVGKVTFDSRENDPFAYMVGQKVKSGIISAGSVGFKPNTVEFVDDAKDPTRMVHRKWELMEFSICNVPSNHNALAQRSIEADGDNPGITLEALDKRLKELETLNAKKTYADILFTEEGKPSLPRTETKIAFFNLPEGGKPSRGTTPDAFTQLGESRHEG